MGMTQLPTSGGHSQTIRLVEHFDEADEVSKKGHNWDTTLKGVLFPYRSTYLTLIYRDATFYVSAL